MPRAVLGFTGGDVELVWTFFKMNLRDKYLGSGLGIAWSVLNPLLLLALFTFVFGYVFKIRLPGAETTLSYAVWLISGYGPWIAIAESVNASASSVVNSAGIVKNMPLKTEVLPVAAALTGVVPLAVSLVFLLALLIADANPPTWHALLVLPVAVLQFAFIAAIGFFLSAFTVFVRDFAIALPNLMLMVLFATPIFYPLASMPGVLRAVSGCNPFYILAEGYRRPLIHHQAPELWGLVLVAALSVVLAYLGLRIFRRVKGYFPAML